jgi:hypothetical protein
LRFVGVRRVVRVRDGARFLAVVARRFASGFRVARGFFFVIFGRRAFLVWAFFRGFAIASPLRVAD